MTSRDFRPENIWIGSSKKGREASLSKQFFVINVASPSENPHADLFIPLLPPESKLIKTDKISIPSYRLDVIAYAMDEALQKKKKVFVHCTQGLEGSPLAVIWYFHKIWYFDLVTALGLTLTIRPALINRLSWISFELKLRKIKI